MLPLCRINDDPPYFDKIQRPACWMSLIHRYNDVLTRTFLDFLQNVEGNINRL